MNLEQIPTQNERLRVEAMEDEILLYDPAGNRVFQLNPSAALIWRLCTGERSAGEVIELLQQAYPDSAGSIGSDVIAILEKWAAEGCIELK